MTQPPEGWHNCRHYHCRSLVPDGMNFCPDCRPTIEAQVTEFRAYMRMAGYLGGQEIAQMTMLQNMLEEDHNAT